MTATATEFDPFTVKIGQEVGIDHAKHRGKTFVVDSLNKVTVVVKLRGGVHPIRVPRELLLPPPGSQPVGQPVAEDVDLQYYAPGTVVRMKSPTKHRQIAAGALFAVISDKMDDKVKVAELGGREDFRTWPPLPRTWFDRVPLADLPAALAAVEA